MGQREVIVELLKEHGELYGLDMVRLSKGRLGRGTIYVYLDSLEDRGVITSTVDGYTGDRFIPRRRYKLRETTATCGAVNVDGDGREVACVTQTQTPATPDGR